MKHIEKESFLYQEQLRENQHRVNRVLSFLSLLLIILKELTSYSLKQDGDLLILRVNNAIFGPLTVIIFIVFVLACILKFRGSGLMIALLSCIVLYSVLCFALYPLFTAFMIFFPVVISSGYYYRRVMLHTGFITIFLFILSCILNLALEQTSEAVHLFHATSIYNIWADSYSAIYFMIIPIGMALIFVATFSIFQAFRGRKTLSQQTSAMIQSTKLETELKTAAEIQRSVLPAREYQTANGAFLISAREHPAREVGGDFYDYFMINDHLMAVLAADVSDKGAPAAMFMMSAKSALQIALRYCNDLQQAITLANRTISENNERGMFLTLWLALIDIRSGAGKFINAGHPLPIFRHKDGTTGFLENDPDLFLGNFPEVPPRVNSFRMEQGDLLLLYTDGVTDAVDPQGVSFGTERLLRIVENNSGEGSVLTDGVLTAIRDFSNESDQFDDITLLALQCCRLDEPVRKQFFADICDESTKRILDETETLLLSLNCPEDKRRKALVAVDEICANLAEHAYDGKPGPVSFLLTGGSSFATLSFSDCGPAFDPLKYREPAALEELPVGGLGLVFVKEFMDELRYERVDDKNHLTMTMIWNI